MKNTQEKTVSIDSIMNQLEPNRIELQSKINSLIDEFEDTNKNVLCVFKIHNRRINIGLAMNVTNHQ